MTAIIHARFMNASGFVQELRRRSPVLFAVAAAHLALFAGMLIAAPFDDRVVTGINPWIKPMKFAISITIYVLTLSWFLDSLPISRHARQIVTRGTALMMLVEIVLIVLQAARGTTSHFNTSTPFDVAVAAIMGLTITVNTLVTAYVAIQFWRTRPPLPVPYLWGIRLGLLLFVLASGEGFAMVLQRAHSVGAMDGGPGLPLVNWSTHGGDLRVAHFVGMHALQALPLFGWLLTRRRKASALLSERHRLALLWTGGLGYLGLVVLLVWQALRGQSVIHPDATTLAAVGTLAATVALAIGVTVALAVTAKSSAVVRREVSPSHGSVTCRPPAGAAHRTVQRAADAATMGCALDRWK